MENLFQTLTRLIDLVTKREMPIEVERIALTMDQIKKYRLPPLRVKRKDSRAKKYIEKFGDNAWEVEALPPRALLYIVQHELRKNIPKEFLEELRLAEEVVKITKPLEKRLVEGLRAKAIKLKQEGIPDGEILLRLKRKYGIG